MPTKEQFILQIIKSIGFYRRQFFFLLFIFLIGLALFFGFVRPKLTAQQLPSISSTSPLINVNILKNGKVLSGGQVLKKVLHPEKDFDFFHWKVLNEEGFYIPYLQIKVNLPESVDKNKITPRIYLIQSLNSETSISYPTSQSIVFTATNLSPSAVLTIEAKLSKGIISFPIWQRAWFGFLQLSGLFWLIFGLSLPALTFIILIWMFGKRLKLERPITTARVIDKLPYEIPAAVVGILPDAKVGSREIAAILVDLAQRGFIEVVVKDNLFTFAKTKKFEENYQQLLPFEKILLSKIFKAKSFKATGEEIRQRIAHHIFSRKIAQVYWEIYKAATDWRFFEQNPAAVHFHYKFIGILLFFFALAGFALGAIFGPEPKFLLFPFLGMILASLVIIKLAAKVPTRTALGSKVLTDWLSFKNYLVADEPIPYSPNLGQIYQKYLPYAIVLGCEVEWTKRFLKYPFVPPAWFTSSEKLYTLEDFSQNLFPLIGFVSLSLALSHEPSVE